MAGWIGSSEVWYTLGPASIDRESPLFAAGATGVRLTFSFGTPQLQLERAHGSKAAARRVDRSCTVVADLSGEKFRLGTFANEHSIEVSAGTPVRFVTAQTANPTQQEVVLPVPNPRFVEGLRKGHVITVGDGAAILEVTGAAGEAVVAQAQADGVINHTRGLTVQGSDFVPVALTDKDIEDLQHVLKHEAYDALAISFVSSIEPLRRVKAIAKSLGRSIPIVAKIETAAGVAAARSIAQEADCLMAARGDLALAIPWVELPAAVAEIQTAASETSTPWILATQVMEGLERFAIPTRAEICDLAHWAERGCAGVLLSYETAFGKRPVAAVNATSRILKRWSR